LTDQWRFDKKNLAISLFNRELVDITIWEVTAALLLRSFWLKIGMANFRHNLSPVEVTIFLRTVAELTENLLIRYCHKNSLVCPQCGHPDICRAAAVSVFSSSFDKITHEITACLHCRYKNLTTLLTCERL
jgi:hypothetical protein